jgi:hypothetical protein
VTARTHEFTIAIKREPGWDFYLRRARAREILNNKDFLKESRLPNFVEVAGTPSHLERAQSEAG